MKPITAICQNQKVKPQTTKNRTNARAAVWFTGLREISKKFKLQGVYDLSATPYYLTGSGYTAYSLFPSGSFRFWFN